ncbi:hypothetical protein ABH926_005431 [Catenulispora sp. GP43]|uniref:hypothetical protein n=1 Tax=Catenulispora sp. GP43 TaxID=3156263 RepID=UPI003511DDB8
MDRTVGVVNLWIRSHTTLLTRIGLMSIFTNALTWPFLTSDVKLRLRHQRLDAAAGKRAGWALEVPDVAVKLVKAVDDPCKPGRDPGMRLVPVSSSAKYPPRYSNSPFAAWYSHGAIEWDHHRVTVTGTRGSAAWAPDAGGLRRGFDAVEVFQAGRRPTGSGNCLARVAAIATVGLAGHGLRRIVFLDAETRDLGWIPASYFKEEDVIEFARAVGIAYRSYAFTLAGFSATQVWPPALCDALFTPSARRVKFVGDELDMGNDWVS